MSIFAKIKRRISHRIRREKYVWFMGPFDAYPDKIKRKNRFFKIK